MALQHGLPGNTQEKNKMLEKKLLGLKNRGVARISEKTCYELETCFKINLETEKKKINDDLEINLFSMMEYWLEKFNALDKIFVEFPKETRTIRTSFFYEIRRTLLNYYHELEKADTYKFLRTVLTSERMRICRLDHIYKFKVQKDEIVIEKCGHRAKRKDLDEYTRKIHRCMDENCESYCFFILGFKDQSDYDLHSKRDPVI